MNNINFKNWAFRFTIWIVIINIISFFLTVNYTGFAGFNDNTGLTLYYLGIISLILLILTIVYIVISTIKKEIRDYKYWISLIGIFIFGILPFSIKLLQLEF